MAKIPKRPELSDCKVTSTSHPKAPWRVFYTVEANGKRKRVFKSFSTEDKAWVFAEDKDLEISNHGVRYGDIPPEVRRAYDFFRDESASLRDEGADVPRFEELISNALTDIRLRHRAIAENAVTVAEGVEMFLAYKKSRVKERQLANLTDQLKRFAQEFGDKPFEAITTNTLDAWLSGLRSRKNPDQLVSPLTRNHYRATVHALFSYGSAKARLWCSINPVADLERELVASSKPKAYSPEDTEKILQAALNHMPELLPVLALGFFAGLRVSEARAFDLGTITSATKEFRISDDHKTGARIVPFLPSCRAWLFAQPRRKGIAFTQSDETWDADVLKLFKLAKVEKLNNGARHSFISYRCAKTRNPAQVADEAGNSPGTIKKHYRELVTSKAAEKYFAIRPEAKAENVTSIEDGRASA